MNQLYEKLQSYMERAYAIQAAMRLFEWDDETLAPKESGTYTSVLIGNLASQYYESMTDKEVETLIRKLSKDSSLSEIEVAEVREAREQQEQLTVVPKEEYQENSRLTAESTRVWVEAKEQKDFEVFAPTLEKIIEFQKKFAFYRKKRGESLYDTMLKTYEKDFNIKLLDEFFEKLKMEIVPLMKRIRESGKEIDDSFLVGDYKREGQEALARWIAEYVGFDFDRGVLAESAHPFTTNFHNRDVRITTHYTENISHSLFSVIHEAGHAIYELGISDDLTMTLLGEGASMAMHESQSRFCENMIGRNKAFLKPVFEKMQELFPDQLKTVTQDQFWKAINKVTPGPVRIEADELTYSLHILIRYEIEKQLIDGKLEVKDLPKVWNEKYEEYLGITPEDCAKGVLQDVHWSQGSFGYFPSYALGSAFGAQYYYFMQKDMNLDELLSQGKIEKIREFLKDHVHRYGKLKTSRDIIRDMTGEDFTPEYYIRYLKEKYEALYELK